MLSYDIKNALLTTRLCQYLDPQELDMLIIHNKIVTYAPGEIILKQGRKSSAMYIIIDGNASVTAKILGEGIMHLATLDRGNFIGEISLIDKGPCATSVRAITEVKCLMISEIYFEMLSIFFSEIKFKLMRAITKEVYYRLQDEHHKIIDFMKQIEMTTQYSFREVIKSTSRPGQISFDEAQINPNELRKADLFSNFSNDEYKKFLRQAQLIKAAKNTTLIAEGEKNLVSYIVVRGAVQSSIVQENKIAKLAVLGPIMLFASTTCIDGSFPSIIDYTTCEDAILLKLTESTLLLMQKRNLQLWYKMFELISKSIVNLERVTDKLDIRLNSELYNR